MHMTTARFQRPANVAPPASLRRPKGRELGAVLASLALWALCVAEVEASSLKAENPRTPLERSVDACVNLVRHQLASSTFEAVVAADRVNAHGTKDEHIEFQKCMTNRGKNLVTAPAGLDFQNAKE